MQLASELKLFRVSVVDFSEETRGVEVGNSFYFALPAFDEGFDVLSFYFINDIQQKRKLVELREPFWRAIASYRRCLPYDLSVFYGSHIHQNYVESIYSFAIVLSKARYFRRISIWKV
jgi:hypothetical protein